MVSANEETHGGEPKLVDLQLIVNLLAYAAGSVVRHKGLILILFAVIFGGAVSSLFLMPKTYHVETRLFVQRNSALALKGDNQADSPGHSASETILRRDNLAAIVRQTDLIHEWYKRRAPLAHLRDVIARAVGKPEAEEDTVQWMTDVLEKRTSVQTQNDALVDIAIDWPDPVMALRLLDAAQQNYLDARRATEVTAIEEQVGILQSHAATVQTDINTAVDALEQLRAKRLAKPAAPAAPMPSTSASAAPSSAPARTPIAAAGASPRPRGQPDGELTRLRATIEAKQRAVGDLEEFRRRKLSELNATLAEKSATYTENHPALIDLRQTIASLSTESPEAQAMRADVDRLQKELDFKTAVDAEEARETIVPGAPLGATASTPPPLPGSIIRIEQEPSDERDPEMMYARARLRDAMEKYSGLRAQIEIAQIEFDTAQAAFKYRYTVIAPAVYPKKPSKPNALLVAVGGLVGGLLVGILSAIAVDVRKGRFLAAWQVEQALDLPMLAELDTATLARHKIE
jgi:uncharacterized protein involved in exopolysaccharide biosynthesis